MLPVDPREKPESVSKEGGDEEVSKPALIVVWVQAAGADLEDVELRYAEDPQRLSSLPNRRPELRLAGEAVRAGACAAEALVIDAPPKGFYVSVAGCRGPYDFEQLPRAVVHTPCVASDEAQLSLGGGLFELLTKPGLPLHLARFPTPDGRFHRRLEQVALVGKHLIDGRHGYSRLGGDVLDAGPLVAPRFEHRRCSLDDASTGEGRLLAA